LIAILVIAGLVVFTVKQIPSTWKLLPSPVAPSSGAPPAHT